MKNKLNAAVNNHIHICVRRGRRNKNECPENCLKYLSFVCSSIKRCILQSWIVNLPLLASQVIINEIGALMHALEWALHFFPSFCHHQWDNSIIIIFIIIIFAVLFLIYMRFTKLSMKQKKEYSRRIGCKRHKKIKQNGN